MTIGLQKRLPENYLDSSSHPSKAGQTLPAVEPQTGGTVRVDGGLFLPDQKKPTDINDELLALDKKCDEVIAKYAMK